MINFQRTLQKIVIGGLFLVPFIPLFVANTLFFPYITGKAFAFRIIIEILLALWLVLIYLDLNARPKRSAILWTFLGLIVVTILATVFGADPYRSFWSNFERMDGLVSYLHLAGYFLLLIANFRSEKLWRRWWFTTLMVSVIVVFSAMVEFGRIAPDASARLATSFGNPIYLAVYLLIHLFIAGWFLSKTRQRWQQIALGLLMIGQFWALYNTGTRSALLGLGLGILTALVLIIFRASQYPRAKYIAGILIIMVGAIGATFWLARDSQFVKSRPILSRLTNISLADATTRHRLLNWQMAIQGLEERPVLGWGPENYIQVFSKYFNPQLYDAEPWFDRTHNIFLDWIVSAGLLGLLGYLLLYVFALYYLWRRNANFDLKEQIIFTSLFVAYLFHNVFVFDNLTSYLLFFAMLGYFHFRSVGVPDQRQSISKDPSSQFALLTGAILLVLSATIYYVNIRPWQANQKIINALMSSDAKARFTQLAQAIDFGTLGTTEASEQLVSEALKANQAKEAPQEIKKLATDLVKKYLPQQILITPNNVRLSLFYGSFLRWLGDNREAVKYLEQARLLAPQKQPGLIELAQAYLALGEKESALKLAQEAYELEPKYSDAFRFYIFVLTESGQTAKAKELLKSLEQQQATASNSSRQITDEEINSYVGVGNFEKVLELWQIRVSQKPNDAQSRFSLAAAYLKVNNTAKAIEQLLEAKKIEPRAATQVDKLITEIKSGRNPMQK
jgi:O-antigen ligase/Flp pilus assembly protein TadD